jgi:hypothetical protein
MFQRITTPGRCALVVVPAFAIVLAAPGTAPAKDKRHANVVVENKTGNVIEVVTVAHKYSDNYKQAKTWGNLPNGSLSRSRWWSSTTQVSARRDGTGGSFPGNTRVTTPSI